MNILINKKDRMKFKYYPNTKTRKELGKIEEDVKKGKKLSISFSDDKKMDEYLNSL